MKKYYILALLVALVGILVWQAQLFRKPTPAPTVPADWAMFMDVRHGITFRYPAKLSTTYITAQTWPPTISLASAMPACTSEPNLIDGHSYCVHATTDGAAGSVYTDYAYATASPTAGQTVIIEFTLRSVQCANYDDPQKTACNQERTSFSVDQLVGQIFSTIQLSTPRDVQFAPPLDRAPQRITKKPFGIYITPQTSPVQPEKFTGYHTGADFEIFSAETDAVVPIQAICDGKVLFKQWVSGYGGVVVQSCSWDNQPITVLYGHLDPNSAAVQVGDQITLDQVIGQLGVGYSHDTDGERKHLHLGIHRGSQIVLAGYVAQQSALDQWVDPTTLWSN